MSRNNSKADYPTGRKVAPREGRVSRNHPAHDFDMYGVVAPREGRVSRNFNLLCEKADDV